MDVAKIIRKKKINSADLPSAKKPKLEASIEKLGASKVPSANKVMPTDLKGAKSAKSDDLLTIDLMLGSAKKKPLKAEIEVGPTEVDGKTYEDEKSKKYKETLKKLRK